MWQIVTRLLLAVASISFWITLLAMVGTTVNKLVIWDWLTDFFAIMQRFMFVFDFTWNVPVTIEIIKWIMVIDVSYWLFLAGLIIVRRFNKV